MLIAQSIRLAPFVLKNLVILEALGLGIWWLASLADSNSVIDNLFND
jgi:hypothetical protein